MSPGKGGDDPDDDDDGEQSNSLDGEAEKPQTKEPRNDDTAESSSTGSSDGKGSGGGYSADCSDQSSDDTGTKEGSQALVKSVGALNLAETSSESSGPRDLNAVESEAATVDEGPAKEKSTHNRKKKTRKSHELVNVDEILKFKSENDAKNSTLLLGERNLPQLNGVKISHPMDPRIDLSKVEHVLHASVPAAHTLLVQSAAGPAATHPEKPSCSAPVIQGTCPDTYMQLLEVVRPFFREQGVEVNEEEEQQRKATAGPNDGTPEEPVSSEGFTSFFSTTNSNGTNTPSTESSDGDKKVPAKPKPALRNDDKSDSSSLVVLARVKRKHKQQGKDENGASSGSSSEKRVRIVLDPNPRGRPPADQNNADAMEVNGNEQPEGSGTSSSSSSHHHPNPPANPLNLGSVPPRIVTDVSSSNRTDSAVSNTATSGSGSGGNTGSGSNQGSSGSGNEGKGSSEDLAKEDNSGDAAGGSDVTTSDKASDGATIKAHHRNEEALQDPSKLESRNDFDQQEQPNATREQKLQVKKRKRIEMRREYEAQQQFESSESSNGDVFFRPGKPVTLDEVLSFSRIARLVIQAVPPFLVVHTNAAYTRLTGIDSHTVVGKPVASLLRVPEKSESLAGLGDTQRTGQHPSDSARTQQEGDLVAAAAAGRARAEASRRETARESLLERLVAASGFGRIQFLQATAQAHQMVGRNVSFINEGTKGEAGKDEGSHATSLSSNYEGPPRLLSCRASIAPIVSAHESLDHGFVNEKESETDHKSKRRKHTGTEVDAKKTTASKDPAQHRRHPHRPLVTHYVIQLEHQGIAPVKNDSIDTLSSNSTSVEARLLGLTKAGLKQQRAALGLNGAVATASVGRLEAMPDDDVSESTETRDPVSAIG